MNIYDSSKHPIAEMAFLQQQQMHWMHTEVPLNSDVADWLKLGEVDKNVIASIFRFFTQSDLEVSEVYNSIYPKLYPDDYQIRDMFSAFANQEAIHSRAYAYLMDTLGFDESTYTDFFKVPEMAAKYDLINKLKQKDQYTVGTFFATFIEGVSLFGMFMILMSFNLKKGFSGMNQIITWSIRDETLHVESMTKLNASLMTQQQKEKAYAEYLEISEEALLLEYNFIKHLFSKGNCNGLSYGKVKDFIKWLSDIRLRNLHEWYNIKNQKPPMPSECPVEWYLDRLGFENVNFFVTRSTQYKKIDQSDVDWDLF